MRGIDFGLSTNGKPLFQFLRFKSGLKLFVIQLISSSFKHFLSHSWRLQSDCGNCSLIVEIVIWLLRLEFDCWDCSLIGEIAHWLLRLHSDCGDCSLIAEIAKVRQLTYTCPSPEQGLRHVARCFILIAEIAVRLLRLQSDCLDCNQIAEFAVILLRLQTETVCWLLATLWNVDP